MNTNQHTVTVPIDDYNSMLSAVVEMNEIQTATGLLLEYFLKYWYNHSISPIHQSFESMGPEYRNKNLISMCDQIKTDLKIKGYEISFGVVGTQSVVVKQCEKIQP